MRKDAAIRLYRTLVAVWRWRHSVALLAMLALCGTASAEQNLSIANAAGGTSPQQIAADAFAAELGRLLPGRFRVTQKGGSMLGSEQDIWETLRLGALDLAVLSTSSLAPVIPQVGVFDIPYLFRDSAHAAKVLDGPLGRDIGVKIDSRDVVFLAFVDRGFRHLTNSRHPITTPADLVGLKIRVIPSPVMEMTFKALGAQVVPMPVTELFRALRENRLDGEENPLLVIETRHFDQVQKFLSLTGHVYSPAVILVNGETYRRLSSTEQAAFARAAKAAASVAHREVAAREHDTLLALQHKGMKITETIDREAFAKVLAPLDPEWEKRFGAVLLKRIRETR